MKSQFHFDKKTGTMVKNTPSPSQQASINTEVSKTDVSESKNNDSVTKPFFEKEKQLDINTETANVCNKSVVL